MKQIAILGSTGSIGVSTLDVIGTNASRFTVTALSAGRNIGLLKEQIIRFRPAVATVLDEGGAQRLREMLGPRSRTAILHGVEGYREAASMKDVDTVVSAMVGAAGLVPTMAAIEAGKTVALANKETMVMAGNLVVEKAAETGAVILPVDSEHSAVFQSLAGHDRKGVRRILLTASGGPFRGYGAKELARVTVSDALKHPNWEMGRKITIDSASMMNKGLEVIEARWLFDIDVDRIDVIIHPQSIVHSLVEYMDGSMVSQLGVPDMRVPISYALLYPERLPACDGCRLDLCAVADLEFYEVDFESFPNLRLAYRAARAGGTMPAVLNAANESAVDAFLAEEIGFMDMPAVIEETLDEHENDVPGSIGRILSADRWAREKAARIIARKRGERCSASI
ncbi:MAG: 1-deoxy-D-xylulose-5-phosphate reductoisomerase [Deltaproteobacteria bacterium]|nr:1-deoxy-D-xylulose-5-phosphate reductoisomerase [Deltaproteobacteria bacterium]